MSDEKTHTATGRMFDKDGTLAAIAGDEVPASVWKGLTPEVAYPVADNGAAAEQAAAAAEAKKRGPARETR